MRQRTRRREGTLSLQRLHAFHTHLHSLVESNSIAPCSMCRNPVWKRIHKVSAKSGFCLERLTQSFGKSCYIAEKWKGQKIKMRPERWSTLLFFSIFLTVIRKHDTSRKTIFKHELRIFISFLQYLGNLCLIWSFFPIISKKNNPLAIRGI